MLESLYQYQYDKGLAAAFATTFVRKVLNFRFLEYLPGVYVRWPIGLNFRYAAVWQCLHVYVAEPPRIGIRVHNMSPCRFIHSACI